jgi:hypothetical protein
VFWNVTLPNIRWGLLYGVILTNARAMGEFGAVSVISGGCRQQSCRAAAAGAGARWLSSGAACWAGARVGCDGPQTTAGPWPRPASAAPHPWHATIARLFARYPPAAGNIIGKTQTLTLFVESAYKEYNTEAAFAAAGLLSFLALATLFIKDKVEAAAAAETMK